MKDKLTDVELSDNEDERDLKYGRPTPEQLSKISKMTLVPMEADDLFVFRPLMIDDQETSRNSKVHPNLLQKFIKDSNRGIALLMSHNNDLLPVGRTFNTELINEYDSEHGYCNSLYGEVYIDLGRNTETGMNTTDIAKGIVAGTIFDVSVGFSAKEYKCSICNNDIRNYSKCEHYPGRDYVVDNEDGSQSIQKCIAIIGENGVGELVEISLVYAGACGRATIKHSLSDKSVTNKDISSKLSLVNDIKKVPSGATIYQTYSKNVYEMYMTDNENSELKRSESNVEYLEIVKNALGLELDNETELQAKLEEYKLAKDSELQAIQAELEASKTELETSKTELETSKTELETSKEELTIKTQELLTVSSELEVKDSTITELTTKNEELTVLAGVAETYQQDLVKSTVESGIRVQGNAFQAEMFEKFLNTLSLDEVKKVKEGFEAEFALKFPGTNRASAVNEPRNPNSTPTSREDFDTEPEFRAFIAEKAVKYATENSVSIKEATQQLINQFNIKRSE